MNSSRTTIIGIGLIMLVFFAWMMYNQPKKVPPVAPKPTTAADTSATSPQAAAQISQPADIKSVVIPADTNTAQVTKYVETPLVSAIISSHGGNVVSWVLKNYKTYMQAPLEMVDHTVHSGDVNLDFVASDGRKA